jgi:hypothetical protein
MTEEIEYFENKRPNRVYISKSFAASDQDPTRLRIISKVFDPSVTHEFVKIKKEIVLRSTQGERQEVKAVFYEDDRHIENLTIQRFTRETGTPHRHSFTFQGDEIKELVRLIRLVQYVHLEGEEKERLDEEVLNDVIVSADQKRRFLIDNADLVVEVVRCHVSKADVVALAYRKEQLNIFDRLLHDKGFFENRQVTSGKAGPEAVWQHFFECNPWIFGYGLQYVYTSGLTDKQLEQVVAGASIVGGGKRVDALLKTLGAISSLCFVELKTHVTPLLLQKAYRSECWQVSYELSGAIAQIQKTVHKATRTFNEKWQAFSTDGTPTSETTFLFHPKAFVVIGDLHEFVGEHGVNEQKFGSFELFRRSLVSPEVLTYDELFERARCIVEHYEVKEEPVDGPPEEPDFDDYDDVPL